MRSTLGGHFSGTGMLADIYDTGETYRDNRVLVRLTHDPSNMKEEEFEALCKELSGEVNTYFVEVK